MTNSADPDQLASLLMWINIFLQRQGISGSAGSGLTLFNYYYLLNARYPEFFFLILHNKVCRRYSLKVPHQGTSIEDIQIFGVNMTFISSSEVKKCIFHECRRHEWNIHFFTSRDEIKVIFMTNIWIFFLLYTSLSIEEMQILHLQGKVWHAVLSLGAMTFMFCFVWWH